MSDYQITVRRNEVTLFNLLVISQNESEEAAFEPKKRQESYKTLLQRASGSKVRLPRATERENTLVEA
jgi:hypothetical protein